MAHSIGLDLPGAGEIMRMIMSLQSPGKVDGLLLDFAIDTVVLYVSYIVHANDVQPSRWLQNDIYEVTVYRKVCDF